MAFFRPRAASYSLLIGFLTGLLALQGVMRVAPLLVTSQDAAHCDVNVCTCEPGHCTCMTSHGEHADDSPTGTKVCGCSMAHGSPSIVPPLPLDKALISKPNLLRELPLQGSWHVEDISYQHIFKVEIFHPPRLVA